MSSWIDLIETIHFASFQRLNLKQIPSYALIIVPEKLILENMKETWNQNEAFAQLNYD